MDPIAFSGSSLDRANTRRRDEAWLEARRSDPASRFLPLWRLNPLVKLGPEPSLAWARQEIFEELGSAAESVLLGVAEGVAHFALDVSTLAEPEQRLGVAELAKFEDLRAAAGQLPVGEAGMAAQARSLIDWHRSNGWCPGCGAKTQSRQGGALRTCIDCQTEHYPRTNPVVIAVVTDGERCLLGRSRGWPATLYSALAGFIEPGETLEEGVRREVLEESGVRVGAVHYVKSQPWPFPASLMIGCIAEAESTEIEVDAVELEHAEWFSRDTVESAMAGAGEELIVPPAFAVAHHLMRAWLESS